MNIGIAAGTSEQFRALQAIELACFETLRKAGAVSGDARASSDEDLQRYLDAGLLLAALDESGGPVGFGGGYVAEQWLHIAEVDVHPNWQRSGIGRRLMGALLDIGRARALKGATLTTDRYARFNAPFYASLGFGPVVADVCPAHLKTIQAAEERQGLPAGRRVAMMCVF